MFACGYSAVRVAAFFGKLAHFLAFVGVVTVVTAESEKLRECDGIFYVFLDERTNVASSYENQLVCSVR